MILCFFLFQTTTIVDAVLGFRSFTMQLATSSITLSVNFHKNQPGYDTKIIMQKKKSALMTLHNSSSINTVNINNTHTK